MTRSFESNGPDVKIRGTPAHIAEKYITLARDAKSSGDEVLAENYLQHAEHYNRIIMAFREQQISQGGEMAGGGMGQRFRVPQLHDNMDDDDFSEDGDDTGTDQPQSVMRHNEPQPSIMPPAAFEGGERPERIEGRDHPRPDRQERQHGGGRFEERQRRHPDQFRNRDRDRDPRQNDFTRHAPADRSPDRSAMEPPAFPADRGPVPPAAGAEPGFEPVNGQRPRPDAPRRRERFQPQPPAAHEQPEFLRRPVRRPRRETEAMEAESDGNVAPPAPPARDDGENRE